VTENHLLGKFELEGIDPEPRGVPEIKVSFKVNTDGVLDVSAFDKKSGKSDSININYYEKRLSADEVAKHVEEEAK